MATECECEVSDNKYTHGDNMSDVVYLQTQHVSRSVHVPDEQPRLHLIYPGAGPGDDSAGAGGGHHVQDIR